MIDSGEQLGWLPRCGLSRFRILDQVVGGLRRLEWSFSTRPPMLPTPAYLSQRSTAPISTIKKAAPLVRLGAL
jgi:hypothetical protein